MKKARSIFMTVPDSVLAIPLTRAQNFKVLEIDASRKITNEIAFTIRYRTL